MVWWYDEWQIDVNLCSFSSLKLLIYIFLNRRLPAVVFRFVSEYRRCDDLVVHLKAQGRGFCEGYLL